MRGSTEITSLYKEILSKKKKKAGGSSLAFCLLPREPGPEAKSIPHKDIERR